MWLSFSRMSSCSSKTVRLFSCNEFSKLLFASSSCCRNSSFSVCRFLNLSVAFSSFSSSRAIFSRNSLTSCFISADPSWTRRISCCKALASCWILRYSRSVSPIRTCKLALFCSDWFRCSCKDFSVSCEIPCCCSKFRMTSWAFSNWSSAWQLFSKRSQSSFCFSCSCATFSLSSWTSLSSSAEPCCTCSIRCCRSIASCSALLHCRSALLNWTCKFALVSSDWLKSSRKDFSVLRESSCFLS